MIPSSHFELVAGPEDNDTYIDYEFTDRSPRSAFRTWKLWWDAEVQKWFALLMRSQTEESEFNHEVKLSARFVSILRGAIPSSHLAARLVEAAAITPPTSFDYSPWRHGGWYVNNVRYPTGAIGCVSRNYADKKWRIVCDPRPFDDRPTFKTRDAAALAEWHLTQEQPHG